MRTATVHIPLVEEIYTGPTRVFRLSPPLPNPDGPGEFDLVAVCVQPGRRGHQLPELLVFAAEPTAGAPLGPSMRKLPGSQPLYEPPVDPVDGWLWALLSLGVTEVAG